MFKRVVHQWKENKTAAISQTVLLKRKNFCRNLVSSGFGLLPTSSVPKAITGQRFTARWQSHSLGFSSAAPGAPRRWRGVSVVPDPARALAKDVILQCCPATAASRLGAWAAVLVGVKVLGSCGTLLPRSPLRWWERRCSHSCGFSKSVLCLAACQSGVVLLLALVVSKIISYSVAGETRSLRVVFDFLCPSWIKCLL